MLEIAYQKLAPYVPRVYELLGPALTANWPKLIKKARRKTGGPPGRLIMLDEGTRWRWQKSKHEPIFRQVFFSIG